ncbi:MAG: hypothetical protein WC792_02420 [Candidatus Micrarchaeia archaeon]|jgi:hypothetical protein
MAEDTKEYSESELDALFDKAAKEGAVLALLHFDAHGADEKTVRDLLVDLVSRLTKERGVLYCKGEIEESIATEKLYSSCAEVKMMAETFQDLLNLSLRYTPIAIEILKPREIRLSLEDAQSCLLDAAQTSQDYTNYVLQKVLPPEELAKFNDKLKRHAEIGAKLVEKAHKEEKQ